MKKIIETNEELLNARVATVDVKEETKEVIISEGITEIGSFNFYSYTNLEKVVLPESIKIIGEYAFANCEKLKEINIPDTIERIGSSAFVNCDSLDINAIIPDGLEYTEPTLLKR